MPLRADTTLLLDGSGEVLRALAESSPDFILLIDCEGTIEFLNRAMPPHCVEEVIGTSALDYIGPSVRPIAQAAIERVLATGEIGAFHVDYDVPGGGRVTFESRIGPLWRDGEITGMAIISRDVTQALRDQQIVRPNADFLASMIDTAVEGIVACTPLDDDPFLYFWEWNSRMEEITGYDKEEINRLGWHRTIFSQPDLKQRSLVRMREMLAGKHLQREEWLMTHKDGSPRITAISTSSAARPDGTPAIVALVQDITERRRWEEALHASQSENEALFNAIPDIILRVRRDGTYLRYKPPREFQPWKSGPAGEVVGKNIRDSVPQNVAARAFDAIEAALATKRTQHFQFSLPIEGAFCFREARVAAAGDNEVLIIIRDITERKRSENERRDAEQRLEQQQQLLAHASRLNIVGEMAAGLAHEITQPLGAISNFAAAAATTLENATDVDYDRLLQWNRKIIEQASRAGQIIDRLRRYAQRSDPVREQHLLSDIVAEAIDLVQTHARRHGVAIQFSVDAADSLIVVVDRVQIQQVVVNLLNNAIEALESVAEGERNITVCIDAGPASASIHIDDSGPGLPVDDSESLFEPFFTTKPLGMGMGLTICRSLVQAHEGTIAATNLRPHGASFSFTLPRES